MSCVYRDVFNAPESQMSGGVHRAPRAWIGHEEDRLRRRGAAPPASAVPGAGGGPGQYSSPTHAKAPDEPPPPPYSWDETASLSTFVRLTLNVGTMP